MYKWNDKPDSLWGGYLIIMWVCDWVLKRRQFWCNLMVAYASLIFVGSIPIMYCNVQNLIKGWVFMMCVYASLTWECASHYVGFQCCPYCLQTSNFKCNMFIFKGFCVMCNGCVGVGRTWITWTPSFWERGSIPYQSIWF